jgi:outer membrane usher protein
MDDAVSRCMLKPCWVLALSIWMFSGYVKAESSSPKLGLRLTRALFSIAPKDALQRNSTADNARVADGIPASVIPENTAAKFPVKTKADKTDKVLPLEVSVNGTKNGTWLLVEHDGALYAPRDAFDDWRLQLVPTAQSIQFKGQEYWSLAAVSGYQAKINFANQSVELNFSTQAFSLTRLSSGVSKKQTVSPVLPSLFFNYDLNYSRNALQSAPVVQDIGMVSEVGFSSNLGVLTSSSLGKNLTNDTAVGNPRRFTRLETTFTKDFLDDNRSLKLGDTITRAGMQGHNMYYGGIQYGTNFSLTPGLIRQPNLSLTGQSTSASTVELYVNDVLRQTSNVPSGPFTIDNFPALTGSGEARMVVRDLLGRETVVTQPFISSNKLLAAGFDDWNVEAGRIRRYLGTESNNYGPAFGRGIWRHGYNNNLTLEGSAEATAEQSTVGLGLVASLAGRLLGTAAFTSSHETSLGAGNQWQLGLEQQGLRSSVFLQAQGASVNFRQLGQDIASVPTKLQLAANWTYLSDSLGSFGLGYASVSMFENPRINTMTANYSVRVGERGSLSLNASRSQGGFNGSSVGLSLVLPLDNDRVVSSSANSSGNQNDFNLSMMQSPTQDNHLGWRVQEGQQQSQLHQQGSLYYLGQYGNFTGDVSSSPDQTALRLGASGGLVVADGHFFASKKLSQSFALVEVAGYGNVGVGLGSSMLSKTNASGVALVPQLVPYQLNSVRLDARDLPVSAEIDSIEQVAVPAYRSVVKVSFPVRSGRGALLKIKLDDGDVVPAGAIVQIMGDKDKQEFYVARRGEAYVTGLQASNQLLLKWNKQQCQFDVTLPVETSDDIPRLGPLLCKGVKR